MNMKTKIILDTDIGSDIDDTWALALLLNSPELDLKLLTTATFDTRYRAAVAAKLLQVAGRTDVPIALGPVRDAEKTDYFQREWLKGFTLADYSGKVYDDAVRCIANEIRRTEDDITLVGIGPFPNIADFAEREPELVKKCRFCALGGSIHIGYHGKQQADAEYNIARCTEASRKALSAPWKSCTLIPLDVCGDVVLKGELYQQVLHSGKPETRALLEAYRVWAPVWNSLREEKYFPEESSSLICDAAAIHLLYAPQDARFEELPILVDEHGRTIINPAGSRILAALEWRDVAGFHQTLTERLS